MRTDQVIQEDVEQELQWDPDLDAINIAVSVKDGVVTLAGFVKSLNDKYEAESAAKRVAGVRAVANDLELRLPAIDERPDPDIARDAIAAITT
jgi:osmotically-inducible protein OsmY